jgi:hypothetical protein
MLNSPLFRFFSVKSYAFNVSSGLGDVKK